MMKHLETLLAQAGPSPDADTGALVPPIHRSVTFERGPDGTYPHGYVYSRHSNPTGKGLESVLAELEGGESAAVFASGMAAAQSALLALSSGDHVLLPTDTYYGVRQLVEKLFGRWGLDYEKVDMRDPSNVEAALRPETRLVWAETPSNPMLHITDLEAVGKMLQNHPARLLVDGTWTTPLLQRPLELGVDLVLHSLTKYLSGHSDVVGGVLVARDEDNSFWERVRFVQRTGGAVMDPSGAWLVLRGLRSLGARLPRHCASARQLARYLASHEGVERVHYPGLETHPGHAIARRQMDDYGGMLSFQVKGGREDAVAVAARTEVFKHATSLGGTESLIEHRASIEAPPTATPDNLLRVSVGLEDADDLQADLDQALAG